MTAANVVTLIVAILGAGGLGALLQTKYINKRTSAQAAKLQAEAEVGLGQGWRLLLAEQRKETNELRERVALLERSEEQCKQELAELKETARQSLVTVEKRVMDLLNVEINKREKEVRGEPTD